MTESEKVEVLLKEYGTLREEILQRSNQRFQFIAIAGAMGAFAIFRTSPLSLTQTAAIIAAVVTVLWVWCRLGHLILRCSRRIAEIERRVNDLAGDDLLQWECVNEARNLFHRVFSTRNKPQERSGESLRPSTGIAPTPRELGRPGQQQSAESAQSAGAERQTQRTHQCLPPIEKKRPS